MCRRSWNEILDLCAINGTIEGVLDVGDGLAFELSFQVNKYVRLRAGLLKNLLQLLSFKGRLCGRPLFVRPSINHRLLRSRSFAV